RRRRLYFGGEEGNSFLEARARIKCRAQKQQDEDKQQCTPATTRTSNLRFRYVERFDRPRRNRRRFTCRATCWSGKRNSRRGHESCVGRIRAIARLHCINRSRFRRDGRFEICRTLISAEMFADADGDHSQIVFGASIVATSFELTA